MYYIISKRPAVKKNLLFWEKKMSEWRDIWKTSIETCQNTIKNKNNDGDLFKKLRNKKEVDDFFQENEPYKDDRMVDFEEGIACECLGLYDKAISIYTKVSDENNGLPVKHWRKRANFFLERATQKKQGRVFSDNLIDNLNLTDLFNVQWNTYYYLHSFVYLPNHLRYLAISSISRIDSESQMAIVIFRTCMEEVLRLFYPELYEQNKRAHKDFDTFISTLYNRGALFTNNPEKNQLELEYELSNEIRVRGNDAAHGNPVNYNNSYLIDTLKYFLQVMDFSNKTLKIKSDKKPK